MNEDTVQNIAICICFVFLAIVVASLLTDSDEPDDSSAPDEDYP